jgi:hypothetical protein
MRSIISMLLASEAANTAPSLVVGQRLDRNGRASIVTSITGEQVAMGDFDGDSHHMPLCMLEQVGYRVLSEVAGADEVALVTASVEAVKSSRKRAQAAATLARETEAAALVAAHPELEVGRYRATAAKNMRTLLKRAFPGVKFSVVQNPGSMVNSITVRWSEGPEGVEVSAIVGRFESSYFDGMTDSNVSKATAWTDTFGGCSGVTMYRNGSYC